MTSDLRTAVGPFLVSLATVVVGGCSERDVGPPPAVGANGATDTLGPSQPGVAMNCPELDPDEALNDTDDMPCMSDEECGDCAACVGNVCVGTGQLRFTLTFSTDSDYDLHVITPDGTEIYFANPTAGGGALDVDQCIVTCNGSGTNVENIFFPQMVPCGTFTVFVVNFDGRAGGDFTIAVDGVMDAEFTGTLEATPGATSEMFEFLSC